MKNSAFIPLEYIYAISYNSAGLFFHRFKVWLYQQSLLGIRIVIVPKPENTSEAISLGMSYDILKRESKRMNFILVNESVLCRHGLIVKRAKKKPPCYTPFFLSSILQDLQSSDKKSLMSLASLN